MLRNRLSAKVCLIMVMNTSMVYCNEVGCTMHGPDLLFCLFAVAYEHHRGVSAAAIAITNQIITFLFPLRQGSSSMRNLGKPDATLGRIRLHVPYRLAINVSHDGRGSFELTKRSMLFATPLGTLTGKRKELQSESCKRSRARFKNFEGATERTKTMSFGSA